MDKKNKGNKGNKGNNGNFIPTNTIDPIIPTPEPAEIQPEPAPEIQPEPTKTFSEHFVEIASIMGIDIKTITDDQILKVNIAIEKLSKMSTINTNLTAQERRKAQVLHTAQGHKDRLENILFEAKKAGATDEEIEKFLTITPRQIRTRELKTNERKAREAAAAAQTIPEPTE